MFKDILTSIWVFSIDKPCILLQTGWVGNLSFFVKLASFVTQPEVKALTRRLWIVGNIARSQPIHSERFVHLIEENQAMFRSLRELTSLSQCLRWIWCQNEPERENIHLVSTVPAVLTVYMPQRPQNQPAIGKLAFFFLNNVVKSCNFKQSCPTE